MYCLSERGAFAYVPGASEGAQVRTFWVARKGTEQPAGAPARPAYGSPRISPDGRRVAVSNLGQVWIYDLARETLTRLTFGDTPTGNPGWTPDGKRVVFQSGTPVNLFWQPADGSGKAERLATSEYRQG